MSTASIKTSFVRFLWGIIPWLMVAGIVAFVMFMGKTLVSKHGRLAEAKNAAMAKEVPAVRVITLTVMPKQLSDKLSLPAEVRPYEDLWVKAEAKGQVVKIFADEGQDVKKGQNLMQLDDRDYRSRLARIQASHKLAKLDYRRMETLAKKNYAAGSRLDEAVARYKELDAQLKEAKLALNRTRITAPISGRLNEIKSKVGDVLDINEPVAQILQIGKVKVTVGVPESDVSAVINLKEAKLVIEALGDRRVIGKKLFLASQPRTLARLYDLELLVDNPDGYILPGMFARVELVKAVFDQALAVPLYAVIAQGDARYVYVEKDGKAERRPVDLGVLIDWQVHVKSGLKPHDHVIVVGHRFLDDGQAVNVIKNVDRPDEIFAT